MSVVTSPEVECHSSTFKEKHAESTVKFFNFYQEFNEICAYIFAVSTFKLPASTYLL